MLREAIWKREDGVSEEEENFEEAINAVNTAINQTEVSFFSLEPCMCETDRTASLHVAMRLQNMIVTLMKFRITFKK